MAKHKGITQALAAFQADLPKVGKGSVNPAFKSKYADLADVVAVVLPALAKQGLAWVTIPTLTENGFVLKYELRHTSGESITGEWPLPDASAPAQALGSAVTYGKRYALSAVTGIAPDDDDDGNAAQGAARTQKPRAPRQAEPPVGWRELIAATATVEALTDIVNRAGAEGWRTQPVMDAALARKAELEVTGGTANTDPAQ